MKVNQISYFIYFLVLTLLASIACKRSDFPGYKKDKNGLHYKMIVSDKNEQKPEIGDYLTLDLIYRNAKDSVLFNSKDMKGGFRIPCQEQDYPGDFFYAVSLMNLNDSMKFVISADSFFLTTIGMPELPTFVNEGDYLFFEAKLKDIMPKTEFEKEQKALLKKQKEAIDKLKKKEIEELDEYIKNNNIGLEPTESGLYYIEINKGKGKEIREGDTVKVHYSGVFLDGQKFDSSYDKGKPVEFKVGDEKIIPGWNEGIKMMREGGKSVFIIPSKIAYGAQGKGNVPPFKTLVFEIELLEVN